MAKSWNLVVCCLSLDKSTLSYFHIQNLVSFHAKFPPQCPLYTLPSSKWCLMLLIDLLCKISLTIVVFHCNTVTTLDFVLIGLFKTNVCCCSTTIVIVFVWNYHLHLLFSKNENHNFANFFFHMLLPKTHNTKTWHTKNPNQCYTTFYNSTSTNN